MSTQAPPGSPAEGVALLMIRANKLDLLERLADDLAHEIKNPLHSMVINLEVLKRRLTHPIPDGAGELLRYVAVLNAELERVNRRIELLLRLARPQRAGDSVTLNELMEESLELLQLEARRRNVTLNFEPAPHAMRVRAAREAVRQVVLNLVLEAVDAGNSEQTLTLRTAREVAHAKISIDGGAATDPDSPRFAAARLLAESTGGQVEHGASLVFTLPFAP